jgi:hypothetical protein
MLDPTPQDKEFALPMFQERLKMALDEQQRTRKWEHSDFRGKHLEDLQTEIIKCTKWITLLTQ